MRWVISSAIDQVLIDRERAAVHLGLRERAEHLRERDRVLDRIGNAGRPRWWRAIRRPSARE
jgi:hypothetical protein